MHLHSCCVENSLPNPKAFNERKSIDKILQEKALVDPEAAETYRKLRAIQTQIVHA